MNRVQEAVADVLGLTGTIRSLESEKETLESRFDEFRTQETEKVEGYQSQLDEMTRGLEQVISDNRMFQRVIEDLDYLNLYDLDKIKEVLPNAHKPQTIHRLRQMRHENPLAKQGVRLIVRFTLGKGINWITKNSKIRDTLTEFWVDPDNKVVLTGKQPMKEFLDETVVDGEKFLACFEAPNVKPYLKLAEVPMEEVVDIIYDPDNRRVPVYYKRQFQEQIYDGQKERYEPKPRAKNRGQKVLFYRDYRVTDERIGEIKDRVKIPASKIAKAPAGPTGEDGTEGEAREIKMMHVYANPLWTKNGRRGISELFASREWFRVLREFMQDRAVINRAAGSFSMKRKIKGGPAAVADMSGKIGGLAVGTTDNALGDIRTLTRPVAGAIYDYNDGADLDWMKTDTGAPNAKEDARMLLMVGGAGIGTNIHYFGEGGDANLATAQAMELPMVKNYEDWQSWLESFFMEVFDYVLHLAYGDNIPFEDKEVGPILDERSEEAVADGNPSQLRLVASNGKEPARIDIEPPEEDSLPEPEKPKVTNVEDVVSWEFPPIISKDVVKHMTAWAQLTQQVAPGDMKIKIEAIKGALTVLGVPNVDQIMDQVILEEQKLQIQREQQRQAMMDAMQNPDQGPAPDPTQKNGNGQPVSGWTKAGSGADADTKRMAKGRPPGAKVGRVAADRRPGTG